MKILFVIGTRPEAIKIAPLYSRLSLCGDFDLKLCNSGQHKDLLDPVLDFFNLKVDYKLEIMGNNQSLADITSLILSRLTDVLNDFCPDLVIVHGDTSTSFSSALAAFYKGIKVAHLEAGLRSFNKFAPFPEEINRSLTGRIADYHFAPTDSSKFNLNIEGITENVIVTGNTVIDALYDAIKLIDEKDIEIIKLKQQIGFNNKRIILLTCHRRENFGSGFEEIFSAVQEITDNRDDILFVFPVHPNPNVKAQAYKWFSENNNVLLLDPLNYGPFIWLINRSFIILTDSGGIQEEAPSLGIPVLVLRDQTERPEAVKAGTVKLVGTNKDKIVNSIFRLLDDNIFYKSIANKQNPYGDGNASNRIIEFLKLL